MRIPSRPPTFIEAVESFRSGEGGDRLASVVKLGIGPAPDGRYRHWETLKRLKPPGSLSSEEWWAAIKLARASLRRPIALVDKQGRPFTYCLVDPVLELLHEIDANSTGPIASDDSITNPQTRDRYIQSSLIEEAITSSQLEGAATTREVAKEMIRSGRSPIDKSERMILNNYRAIKQIKRVVDQELSEDLVIDLHRTVTQGTIESNALGHHLRAPNDGIGVYDERSNQLLHGPPHASEIPKRMKAMCRFANESPPGVFLHPVLKAIILHFWLAYDHPFTDGNGRTARALFYWSMLRQKYWLFEFVSISKILRAAPAQYGRSFLYTETDENDLTYFILHQLSIVKRSIDDLRTYLDRKAGEIRETERLLRASVSMNHRQLAILSHALRHPGSRYSIESHKSSHDVTYQTARTDLLGLEEKALLVRSKRGKAFSFAAPKDLQERLRRLKG